MFRMTFALVPLAVALTVMPAGAADMVQHSGTISRIDRANKTLTLQGMGPWTGPGTGLSTRTFTLAPETRVNLVERSQKPVAGGWPGGYVKTPLSVDQLHPGDFATVTLEGQGHQPVAGIIDIVRPSQG